MLSDKYNLELSAAQNYFGEDFDDSRFVKRYAEAYAESHVDENDPAKRDTAFLGAIGVGERSLEWIIDELYDKAGENIGRVDEELRRLEREGERSLRKGAIMRFLEKSAGGEQNVTDADIEITSIAVRHGLGVLHGLMIHREVEMSFAGIEAKLPEENYRRD